MLVVYAIEQVSDIGLIWWCVICFAVARLRREKKVKVD